MKKVLFSSVLVCLFLIQGCPKAVVEGKWLIPNYKKLGIESGGYIKNYTLGERKTAFIGQEIIKVEKCDGFGKMIISEQGVVVNGTYNRKDFQIHHNNINPIIGTILLDDKTYYVTKDSSNYCLWGILVSDDGIIKKHTLYSHYYEQLYISDSIIINPDKVVYSTSCIRNLPTAISFDLIFAGKNDVSLNTTYKEYSYNDLARPAFFQNLTYQANAKQIRFKNFLIQIHNVTNEQITYTVLEDGLK